MFEGKTIAIVDDQKEVLKLFEDYVKSQLPGNKIHTFNKFSEEFLDNLADYDVVILDYYIDPRVKTLDMIKKIKDKDPNKFIVCVSGNFFVQNGDVYCLDMSLMKNCLDSGATRVSPKNTPEVFDIIDKHLKIRDEGLLP